jgi:hypothetical protein
MTLLNNSSVPTLHAEDNFRLVYNGIFTKTIFTHDKERAGGGFIALEEVIGPLPFGRFVWDGEDYLGGLEEGMAKLVPFDLVRLYWGDPRSIVGTFGRTESRKGVVGDIPPREQEIRRLCVLYGIYDTNMDLLPKAVPDCSITTADGTEVFTPATDPEGKHIYGYAHDTAEVHDIATQLQHMREQIKILETMAKAEDKRGAKNDGSDVEVDGPPQKR